ncbi:uncharacterized protein [Primulina eburnea]|uniref:uncharacterized protein n=1 Tax=Primulina eburnea TaxID=1245227 RepID=UPI003C6C3F65
MDDLPEGVRGPPPPPPQGDPATRVLEGMARLLEQMRDGDRARCAIYLLRDDVSLWWEKAAHAVDLATLTWARFKELLYGKYFPTDVSGRLTREFMSLRQGDSSVAEFIRKFDRGCHFVPMIAGDATQKLRHFLDGYDEATACAFQAEQALRDIDFEMQRKRHQAQSSSQPSEETVYWTSETTGAAEASRTEGHKAADCPKGKCPTTSKAYVMHADEAEATPDSTLITGRIYISGVATHALLDSGAKHSFISESFVKRLGIIHVAMDLGFRVSIPSGDQMFTSRIVRGLELRLQQKTVQADLIVLPLPEFDIILGMDWLSSHGGVIDFHQRSVSVRPPSAKLFVFEAARHQQFPQVISFLCARKLIKRGCQEFLASIVSVAESVSQRLEDVVVVSEFPSVFPDDVSGIPPAREVDFSIELVPGTIPISKAPYRLAPVEMKELKDQIQDLLDKASGSLSVLQDRPLIRLPSAESEGGRCA